MKIELPIRTRSEANMREHWAAKAARAKLHRQMVGMYVQNALRMRQYIMLKADPYWVTLTRIGKRRMDLDNLAGSFKHVQDGVADALKVDDGDRKQVRWKIAQEIGTEYGIRIEIEEL